MKAQIPWVLAIALIASALGLINSQYRARKVFTQLEKAQAETRQLELEWGQLQLRQSSASKHSVVESKAESGELGMVRITKSNTEFLRTE
ncbi:MAG: cell division protein FtsL [Oxalobacter sp.]|nr:cell division protein FtsL [Oxalobacter sp.]